MENINEFLPAIFGFLVLLIVWFVIRRIFSSLSDRINNAELYKEEVLTMLEEIRHELKELNKKNSNQ
jgi:flagellar biosynthesis/type III secretory pathway M-ring protein FliF/YscJ